LPGNNYTSAGTFISNGSGPALLNVTNPDGSTTNLVFDVHKYLDSDNSGTHAECTTDNVSDAFQPLATWLRTNNRMAMNTETGGGNVASCQKYLCTQIAFVKYSFLSAHATNSRLTIILARILTSTWATLAGRQAHLTRLMVSVSFPSLTYNIVANPWKVLTETPTGSGSNMQDTSLVKACLAR
jgi:endoglucanase